MSIPQLSPTSLAAALASPTPPLVIDVREPWELGIARLDGATHMPLDTIPDRVDDIPRDRDVVFVCHHGARSNAAAEWLARQGVRAQNLAGGIDAWSREVDPSVPRY